MIRHIVLYRLKDKSPESIERTAEILRGLRGRIEGLVSVEVGVDALRTDRSCDLALHALFTDRAALAAYRTHPAHLPVQAHMHAAMESSTSADYEIDQRELRNDEIKDDEIKEEAQA